MSPLGTLADASTLDNAQSIQLSGKNSWMEAIFLCTPTSVCEGKQPTPSRAHTVHFQGGLNWSLCYGIGYHWITSTIVERACMKGADHSYTKQHIKFAWHMQYTIAQASYPTRRFKPWQLCCNAWWLTSLQYVFMFSGNDIVLWSSRRNWNIKCGKVSLVDLAISEAAHAKTEKCVACWPCASHVWGVLSQQLNRGWVKLAYIRPLLRDLLQDWTLSVILWFLIFDHSCFCKVSPFYLSSRNFN